MKKFKKSIYFLLPTIFLFLGLGLMIPYASVAGEGGDLQRILEKLDELSGRMDAIEKEQKAISKKPAVPDKKTTDLTGDVENLKEDFEEISARLDEVETKSILDSIKLTGELRTRADWFHFEDDDIDNKSNVNGLFSNRFRLGLVTELRKNLKFHGRLTMYRNFGDGDVPANIISGSYSRIPTDTNLKVERAYVDYFFNAWNIPLALTFGRFPATDGLPTEFRENTARKSTYPALAFDLEADGIIFTAGLEDLIHLPGSSFKFIFSRSVQDNDQEIFKDDTLSLNDLNIFLLQFETGFSNWKDANLILNFLALPEYGAGSIPGLDAIRTPDDMGSLWKWTVLLESMNFLNSNIDWFIGYSYQHTNASGKTAQYGKSVPIVGDIVLAEFGLLNDDGRDDENAFAIHVGARATLPWKTLNYPKLGIEYNHGSRYWWGIMRGAEDPLHKLDKRGDVWDFYYIQPFTKHFSGRIGYTMVDLDYSGSGSPFGRPGSIDQDISNFYMLLDAKF